MTLTHLTSNRTAAQEARSALGILSNTGWVGGRREERQLRVCLAALDFSHLAPVLSLFPTKNSNTIATQSFDSNEVFDEVRRVYLMRRIECHFATEGGPERDDVACRPFSPPVFCFEIHERHSSRL